MEFTDGNIDYFRAQLEKDMKHLGGRFGVTIKVGTINYDPIAETFKYTTNVANTINQKTGLSADKTQWDAHCSRFGMNKEWFGEMIVINGDEFIISAIKPRASKMPVVVTRADNKSYKVSHKLIIKKLGQ